MSARGSTPRAVNVPLALSGLALLGAVWWAATAGGGLLAQRFTPQASLGSLATLLQQPDFLLHVWISVRRVLAALGVALIVGVPMGLLVGAARSVDTALSPAFQFLRMISPLSWMPVVVMVFGVGDRSVLFLLAFAGVWPIMLNTAAGVRALDARWLMLARSLVATPMETLMHVILPGVVGHALTGLRLAIGVVWIVLVPAEMLGVNAGLGYFILDTRDRLAYSELLATVIVIGAVGYLLDSAARRLLRWWVPA